MKVILNPGLSNNPTIYSLPINYDLLKISNSFDKMSWHVFAQRPLLRQYELNGIISL